MKAPNLDVAIERALRRVDLTCISVHNRPDIAAEYDQALVGFLVDSGSGEPALALHAEHTQWIEQHFAAGRPLWSDGVLIHPPKETEHARTD